MSDIVNDNLSANIDEDYTIYLSAEAQESLAAYVCSSCGSESRAYMSSCGAASSVISMMSGIVFPPL